MRSFIIYLFILLIILPSASAAQINQTDEMTDLAEAFVTNDLSISSWTVTMKDQMNQEKAEHIIDQLSNQYTVEKTTDDGSEKYHVHDASSSDGIDIQYAVVVPDSAHYKSEVDVTINGGKWNESIKNAYIKHKDSLEESIFNGNTETFACISSKNHDTIDNVRFVNRMQETLQAKTVMEQTDNVEDSMIEEITYGDSSLWENQMTIDEKPVNLQLVVKKMSNDGYQLTAGTPILINEY